MKDEDASSKTPRSADTTAPAKQKSDATTPDGTPPAGRSGVNALKKLKIPRSAMPYFIAALLAITAMGWYFFAFVPQKLDYFVGLRFRTLAVASGQIKSKAENLALSLNSAPWQPKQANGDSADGKKAPEPPNLVTAEYLRLLVPDIQLEAAPGPRRASALRLEVKREDAALLASVAWGRVASQAAAASASEFDDLVIADGTGDVVWQREKTTPRLGNLKELVYAADDGGTMFSPSSALRTVVPPTETTKGLPRTALLKGVRVGATSSLMLVQAVQLESSFIPDPEQQKLYVAGFVSRYRLQQQAMRIPLAWLVALSLPVAVLFLALPFIKLATMNAKERFSVANLILMAIGTIAAAGLAAVIPVGPRPVSAAGDRTLRGIADRIERNLEREVRDLLALSRAVSAIDATNNGLDNCEVPQTQTWRTNQNCDLWRPLNDFLHEREGAPELDVAILIDHRGWQVRKWTTKVQLTGPAQHSTFEHFRNLASGNLWSVAPDLPRFTMEPLRTPTTAEVGVVFGLPLNALPTSPAFVGPDGDARFLALNVRLRSVIDVVMPPGYGFAIVAPDGKVLFHSTDGLSLEENFFEEVSHVQRVRERMRNEGPITWSGDYHGVPHRIHMQPIVALHDCPWKIVTFEDLSPALAAVVNHQNGTFRLSLINVVLLVILVLFAWWYTKRRGRDIRDVMTAPFSPDPQRLRWLVVLLVLAIAAIAASASEWSIRRVGLLYLFFVLLPLTVLGVSAYARSGKGSNAASASRFVSYELALVVMLVGWAPAAGFARLVERVQNTQATERWLEEAAQTTAAHAGRTQTRLTSPRYSDHARQSLATHKAFIVGAESDAPHFQVAESPFWPDRLAAECQNPPETGQRFLRGLLGWTVLSADRRDDVGVKACADASQLQVRKGSLLLAATLWPDDGGGGPGAVARQWWRQRVDIGWELWLIAMLILGGTIAAAYWAQHRLTPLSAIGRSTFKDVVKAIAADGNQGIMLIGPPRMRKDQWVKRIVARHAGLRNQPDGSDSILRIKLLDQVITQAFIKDELRKIKERAKDPAYLDFKKRLWIQVSNLEAQLITTKRRTAALGLLEQLMDRGPGEPVRVVVVTTTIDPIAHFQEIFTKERADFYDNEIPEVQLSRSSLILSRFRRCYMAISARGGVDPWWNYDPKKWRQTLAWETAGYPPLQEVARGIKRRLSPRGEVSRAELARAFRSQALAPYDLLWESCTRSEKIVLVQLATEGFITTRNCEVVWSLINKGLIVERPRPTIFNNSFRLFLRHIERDEVVEQWEREDGNGLWVVAGRLIGSSLVAGGAFFLVTQDFSFDSLLPVVSGTGAVGAPLLRALLTRVTTRGAEFLT